MADLTSTHRHRLRTEDNIWLSTVRPDGRPHLVPVWFVWHAEKIYMCAKPTSVKIHNLRENPPVALALEDGSKVVICEGDATLIDRPYPAVVLDLFRSKYDWDITTDSDYTTLIEVSPRKWLLW